MILLGRGYDYPCLIGGGISIPPELGVHYLTLPVNVSRQELLHSGSALAMVLCLLVPCVERTGGVEQQVQHDSVYI